MEVIINGILPHLGSETLGTLLEELSSMGVKEPADLSYIQEDDIKHLLSKVDCRRLLQRFCNEGKYCNVNIDSNHTCKIRYSNDLGCVKVYQP